MKRYGSGFQHGNATNEYMASVIPHMFEVSSGEWVKFEDVKQLIIKITQDKTWNDPSIEPIEREECSVMLFDGQIKPALMIDGKWVKLTGYPYPFDFIKSDVIKWRYYDRTTG